MPSSVKQRLRSGCFVAAGLCASLPAHALPIGFGLNQGSLEYSEIHDDFFYVYHDKRTPTEGAMVLNALAAARPILERWFDEKRTRPLPVILSAVSENASFANIVTDAIELQTLGQSEKSLTWHEYTHMTMYSRFRNFFGPAGDLLHVVWLPAWYIEGLAEALSVSVGSDVTAGIERWQALTNTWPSYERLHSLYVKAGFFETGYATSGALVSYLWRKSDANQLPQFLSNFRDYTMPWWWPWTIVPFNQFLPLDAALQDLVGMNGKELYESYKRDARAHWQNASQDRFLVGETGDRRYFSSLAGLKTNGQDVMHVITVDNQTQEVAIEFDQKSGWATDFKPIRPIDDAMASTARIINPDLTAAIEFDPQDYDARNPSNEILLEWRNRKQQQTRRKIRRYGLIQNLFETKYHIAWLEIQQASSRLCYVAKKQIGKTKPTCPVKSTQPQRLRVLGETVVANAAQHHGFVRQIWLHRESEKLAGSQHEILAFDFDTLQLRPPLLTTEARPVAVAPVGPNLYVLMGERNQRSIRRYGANGQCLGMQRFKDHILDLLALEDGSLILSLFAGDGRHLRKLSPKAQIEHACTPVDPPISPLLYAVREPNRQTDLKTAFAAADLWQVQSQALTTAQSKALAQAPGLDQAAQGDPEQIQRAKRAAWRSRPVLAFPWIGAEDAMGTQYGVVSVPLMDHMQNETIRTTFLYGPESRYPSTELTFSSARFRTDLDVSIYKAQSYNGLLAVCRQFDETNRCLEREIQTSYLDENGARIESATPFRLLGGSGTLGLGLKYAHLSPYFGPRGVRHGWLTEPTGGVSLSHGLGRFSWTNAITGRIAPAAFNTRFDYNQLGFSSTLARTFASLWYTNVSLGLEGSRTRGTKRRELQEMYRPLKTFIPGSGGGYNQNSFPLSTTAGSGLFNAIQGDTQGRLKLNTTTPLIRDLEKMIWILYLERLDFSMFYNYGAAWRGTEPRVGWMRLQRAMGYALDLQLDNKGVRFNVGLGTGKVIGNDFEAYGTFGFDALF